MRCIIENISYFILLIRTFRIYYPREVHGSFRKRVLVFYYNECLSSTNDHVLNNLVFPFPRVCCFIFLSSSLRGLIKPIHGATVWVSPVDQLCTALSVVFFTDCVIRAVENSCRTADAASHPRWIVFEKVCGPARASLLSSSSKR